MTEKEKVMKQIEAIQICNLFQLVYGVEKRKIAFWAVMRNMSAQRTAVALTGILKLKL